MAKYFVAGTDTGVGKTLVTCALLHLAAAQGLRTMGLKPVAAGCEDSGDGLRNEDAELISRAMNVSLPYAQVNPVALRPAIAPHIAAQQEGRRITVARLAGLCRGALMTRHDLALIEGAGGWRVPLNDRETLAELAMELQLPVILVVGMRLGCLNHALLTAESIQRTGLPIAGWVANQIDAEMPVLAQNLDTLSAWLPGPCLGHIPALAPELGAETAAQPLYVKAARHLQLPSV